MSKIAWRQKFVQLTLSVAAAGLLADSAAAELYVVRVGDGGAALSNASTAAFIEKFADNGGAPISTIAMPTAASGGNFALTTSGSATSEGFISLSGDGQYLLLGGYSTGTGLAGVASTDSTTVSRVVGRIDLATNAVDTSTVFADSTYSGSNIRSVASSDGVSLWMGGNGSPGANGGVRYATLGATTSTQLASTPTNVRVVKVANGQLYFSSASGTFTGVSAVGTGMPTEAGQAATLLPGVISGATNSSYDFWFKNADTLYVAGDASAANGGGIQKWTQSGGSWSLQYTLLNTGAATTGVRGLTGTVDGNGDAILYATTTANSANQLISVIDTSASATATTLATAPANTVFRGVAFAGAATPPANNTDFNGDGIVDGKDFLIWQRGFGLTGQPNKSTGDANGDGNVNAADLALWKAKFGGPPALAAVGAVPEPATLGMLGVALAAFVGVRRRAK